MPELRPKEPGVKIQQKVISSPLPDVLVRKLHPDKFPGRHGGGRGIHSEHDLH